MITLPAELDRLLPTDGEKTTLENIESQLAVAEFTSETNSAVLYVHIKLPFDTSEENRWFVKVWGVTHSVGEIVDLTYIGKTTLAGGLVSNVELDPTAGLAPTTYVGSDNYIYLRFTPTNTLNTFIKIHSITCPEGQSMAPGEITVTENAAATL